MAGSEPPRPVTGSAMGDRLVVGALLLLAAGAAIALGGLVFALLVGAAALLMFREWSGLTGIRRRGYSLGLALIGAVVVLAATGRAWPALLLLCTGILVLMLVERSPWPGAGLSYAGLPAVALVWMRSEPEGALLVLWTMALVWATDIFAFFTGRAVGGAKIWPAISPSKTWAGLGGGMVAAAVVSAAIGHRAGWPQPLPLLAAIGAGFAILAQAGDFFESWLKRRAGVKDSGRLLPGHGGVMDRLDGLVPVAVAVGLWVALR